MAPNHRCWATYSTATCWNRPPRTRSRRSTSSWRRCGRAVRRRARPGRRGRPSNEGGCICCGAGWYPARRLATGAGPFADGHRRVANPPDPEGTPTNLPHRGQTMIAPASRKIGKYEIVRKLGRGGMADVYLANDTGNGATVALKLIEHGTDADTIAAIEAER